MGNGASQIQSVREAAVQTAFNMSKHEIYNGLFTQPGGKYYPDRQWVNVFAGQNPFFQASGTFTNLVQRDAYFTSAYAASPGMVVDLIEKGAKYPATSRDSDGNPINCSGLEFQPITAAHTGAPIDQRSRMDTLC